MKIILSELAHSKTKYWVAECDKEVSGFGVTSIITADDGTKQIYVHDAWLLEQEVGAAHTDIDAGSLGKLMHKMLTHPTYGGANVGTYNLNWWWHSHVNMNVFWSGTDTETITSIGKNGLCAATVFNKKEEMRSAICYSVEHPIFGVTTHLQDSIPTVYEYIPDSRIPGWKGELDANVKEKKYEMAAWEPKENGYDPYDYGTYKEKRKLSKEDYDWGLIGLGVKKESQFLKITQKQYVKDILDNNLQTIMAHECILQSGIDNGQLSYHDIMGER